MYLPRGCTYWGVYLPGGVPAQGGCTCWGVPAQNDRQVQKYYLAPTSFAGGKDATSKEKEKYTLTRPQVKKKTSSLFLVLKKYHRDYFARLSLDSKYTSHPIRLNFSNNGSHLRGARLGKTNVYKELIYLHQNY